MVELIVGAAVTAMNPIYFQNQPQLQSVQGDKQVWIQAIETYSNQAVLSSPLTAGNAVATPRDIKNGVLVINVAGTDQYRYMPLAILNRVLPDNTTAANFVPSVYDLFLFADLYKVDWTKSYVQVTTTPSALPFSYLFGVYYYFYPSDQG